MKKKEKSLNADETHKNLAELRKTANSKEMKEFR